MKSFPKTTNIWWRFLQFLPPFMQQQVLQAAVQAVAVAVQAAEAAAAAAVVAVVAVVVIDIWQIVYLCSFTLRATAI